MEQSQLLAHCGSSKITREELKVIPTPAGSATHQPLPHFEIVGALVETLSFRQISVVREEYAVTGDGMKMFGVLDLETTFDGCRFSIGVRNSNDKSMRLALTVGYRVLVCDNMAFHGKLRADEETSGRVEGDAPAGRYSEARHLPGIRGR